MPFEPEKTTYLSPSVAIFAPKDAQLLQNARNRAPKWVQPAPKWVRPSEMCATDIMGWVLYWDSQNINK